jgi:ribosomal-protein-alanine N-acetyltransferase
MNGHEVTVRSGCIADLAAVVALERATGTAPHWPMINYAAILQSQRSGDPPTAATRRCLFVALTEARAKAQAVGPSSATHARIMGFAVGMVPPSGQGEVVAELESVAVAHSARRAGTGRALCAAVLAWSREQGAESIALEVRASSAAAIALYGDLGFVTAGRRPRYYREPEDDALLMRLPLR